MLKMKRILPLLLLLVSIFSFSQDYKYLSVENGLSNRKVYSIQKDKEGYMWFLTHDGIDRFNGSLFKNYKLSIDGKDLNTYTFLNQLHKDTTDCIWIVGKKGQLFKYNYLTDKYQLISFLAENNQEESSLITYTYIDNKNNIWLCSSDKIFLYNIDSNKFSRIKGYTQKDINNIIQFDEDLYFISNPNRLDIVKLSEESLEVINKKGLEGFYKKIKTLYYHNPLNKLIIGSFLNGIYIYDIQTDEITETKTNLEDININCIKPLNKDNILIATDAIGIYKMDINDYSITPYLVSQYNQLNRMNGNIINDIYVDDQQRVWMANYPIGITVYDHRYPQYKWIRNSIGNQNSLINDQVNCIIEDSDGDLWFATNNGISYYNSKTRTWKSMLSCFHNDAKNKNYIFLSICEANPGTILIGGYTSGMYIVNKKDFKPHYFCPDGLEGANKYIRSIYKDSKNRIWKGGLYNLKYIDIKNKRVEKIYPELHSVNVILEKDPDNIWVACNYGLFLLNTQEENIREINLPIESTNINTLYQKDGLLYIGTNGSGLIEYNPENNKSTVYNKRNCALISNNIQCILPGDNALILSTDKSISQFDLKNNSIRNWTQEQGLMTNQFNPCSGTATRRNTFVIGSGEGAIEFNNNISLPQEYKSKMVFSDFRLFYQMVSPGEKYSPLVQDINETQTLHLNYNQNIFSLNVSSINYDYPSNIIYSWKLENFYDEWSNLGRETLIRYTNLNPGKYTLRVRAISNEDMHVIEERKLNIIIRPPFWNTIWAMILYGLVIILIAWVIIRYYFTRKEGKASAEKIDFFINTAHDIRTPLSLIKAPLDEILDKETLSPEGEANLLLAIKNSNNLFRLISNLINFEKTNLYSLQLNVEEHELYSFLEESIKQFKSYAESKHVQLIFESNFRFLNVWFDKSKMDSILKNLISNAIKYTPADGEVKIIATNTTDNWSIEIRDTGIGIPAKEQKKLFRMFFRGSNATNLKVPGSGIGLLLVKKLVKLMKGSISVRSSVNIGSSFKVTFRHGNKQFKKSQLATQVITPNSNVVPEEAIYDNIPEIQVPQNPIVNLNAPRLLIVDDNDDLREYFKKSLAKKYKVTTAANGKEALDLVSIVNPNLIIADIMMPEMGGDELCKILKSDINTSHIPIILLTALSDKASILDGLATKADEYLTKPFDIAILKAVIDNILANRAILTKKYAQLDLSEPEKIPSSSPISTNLDHQFMTKVKENIEQNMDKPQFNVDTLCSDLNMSRSSFYNKIKALTGQAPADFIRIQRMNRAAQLLKTKEYTITEIADMVGFSDAKYFREVFKKHFNMPPSQYINENEQ